MSNPPTAAGAANFPHVANLNSLANNTAASLGSVGTGVIYFDDLVPSIGILTGTGTGGSGSAALYVMMSEDNSHWSGGLNPNSSTITPAQLAGMTPLQTITANADSTTFYFGEFSLTNQFGFVPSYWAIVVLNSSGAALAASGHYGQHNLLSYP